MKMQPVTILLLLFLALISNRLWAQENLISNVVFNVDSQKVNVYYDLDGSMDMKYKLTAKLKSKTDSLSEYMVSTYEGQLGEGVSSGYNNSFIWNYKDDINFIPNTTDYEFSFVVEPVTTNTNQPFNRTQKKEENKSSGGSTWYYYVGGAVVLVAALVLTVFRPADKTEEGDPIPTPPQRPR